MGIFWAKYLSQPKSSQDLIEFFQKIIWLIGFEVTVHEILRVNYPKNYLVNQNMPKSAF